MDPPADNGPDGSSIRPVSSLLAKFEGLNKPGETQPSASSATSTRNASPVPPVPAPATKPPRLRERESSPSSAREPPPIPAMRPKDKLTVSSLHPTAANISASSSPTRSAPPPISPRPAHPPSLTVEPPHSPPKRGVGSVPTGDRPAFVSADAVVKPSSPAAAGKQFKIPSRPHTPGVAPTAAPEPRKSPRLVPSQPPSPPPPRRSVELRRERELGHKPVPPPINRAEKPVMGAARFTLFERPSQPSQPIEIKKRPSPKVSPFNSPPSSRGTPDEEDTPPMLPQRPRPQQHQQQPPPPPNQQGLQRSKTFHIGFEPPPLHHSLRRGREEPLTPQITGEARPALPARPQSIIESVRAANAASAPPPRPPRPGVVTNLAAVTQQKRVASTPTSQAPPAIPRLNGRSMTVVDRMPARGANDFRPPPPTPVETRPAENQTSSLARIDPAQAANTYPDTSRTNRSKPYFSKGVHEIATKYDSRIFDVCGACVCTTGGYTRAWSVMDGDLVMSLAMNEGMKGSSVAFKPGETVDEEGKRIWIGTNNGELLEADVLSQSIVVNRPNAHGRYEIIKIYRHFNELWTLDEGGTLHVWGPGPDGSNLPNLAYAPTQTFRLPKGHMFSMVVGDELWHATGKEIRVFLPTLDGRTQFQVLIRPLVQDSAGDVTSGTTIASQPEKVFFGHSDGKVSIYSKTNYACLGVMNISQYKINSLAGVDRHLWAGYNTGKISVYDMGQTPWAVKKDWQAHENPVVKLIADPSSFYKLNRYQVVSLGADNMLRTWDGLLQDDWLESKMKEKDVKYCQFDKIKALILTWNAGASTPNSLNYSADDKIFFENLLRNSDSPDILVFGFQELVDLEDKTATAKRFLKPKKKEGTDQERMSHQYRNWLEFLKRSLDQHMDGELYHVLHSAPLVGLFTAIFVKADLLGRISNLNSAEVKRGMGGLHGNKGAIVVRFMVDDTSLCFINCHLAAGQSGANQRHNDIAAILEASLLPSERDPSVRFDSFVGGGDGTMILDHELCLLNGDLNYRIDTMSRDTVVTAVKSDNLAKLLERDQLLVARRRNPGFRLRAFEEMPITFAPTYKYDVGTDNYDTSEKRRSPAWCDRLLFRCGNGRGRIQQLDYRRHEVRVSDHRPVSGRFRFEVKRVLPRERAQAWMECQQQWEDVKAQEGEFSKFHYLTEIIGYDEATAHQLIGERSGRSSSQHR